MCPVDSDLYNDLVIKIKCLFHFLCFLRGLCGSEAEISEKAGLKGAFTCRDQKDVGGDAHRV
jgi:hypothetical protein